MKNVKWTKAIGLALVRAFEDPEVSEAIHELRRA